jgi:hypothetical protein
MLVRPLAAFAFIAAVVACTTPASPEEGSSASAQTGEGSVLDGTWDITADALQPSAITFDGSKITGTLIMADEGEDSSDCYPLKDRITFNFTVNGNELTGSARTDVTHAWECGGDAHSTTSIRATRSKVPAAGAKTPFEGDWQVSTDGGDPVVVKMAGMVLEMWGTQEGSDAPGVVININGRDATGSGRMSFSARRR